MTSDPAPPDAMTIHQLAQRSGVPARRIRHFIATGLLPPPVGRGRAAHYRPEHFERLQRIQALRDVNLGIEEIKERLGEPSSDSATGQPSAALWQRWEIVSGVELHVRADLDPELSSMARVLASVARQLMTLDGAGRANDLESLWDDRSSGT